MHKYLDFKISNVEKLVFQCGGLKLGEKVCVIWDTKTKFIAGMVLDIVKTQASIVHSCCENQKMHGHEPSSQTLNAMMECDIIFGLTSFSLAHTQARKYAGLNGARFLSLPDYSAAVLNSAAFDADFNEIDMMCRLLSKEIQGSSSVRVATELGSDVTMCIDGRSWNLASGIVRSPGDLGSPPDSEINVAPIEDRTNGVIVIDGSIPLPQIGLLASPCVLEIEDGAVEKITGDGKYIHLLEKIFGEYPPNAVLGEFGIGLNPESKLCGRMLEDEGALGTCHFGIGSNSTIGGMNQARTHIDFIVTKPSIWIDENLVMESGCWSIQ